MNVTSSVESSYERDGLFIHPHWHRYPALPHSAHLAIAFIMTLMGIVALSGNSLVIWVFSRNKSLRTPGNLLVINLAVSDLLLAACGFPLYAIASFQGHWRFGPAVCTFYGWSGGFFGLLSINTMGAIAVDRYLVIVRHRGPARHITTCQAIAMIIFTWAYSFIWSIGPVLGWNRYIPEGLGTTCSYDYLTRNANYTSLIVSMIIGGFIFPLIVIIWCYMSIFTIVLSQKRHFTKTSRALQAKTTRGGGKKCKKTEYKIAKSMLTVVILFCLSWSPYTILSCIGQFGNRRLITPLASAIPGLLAKASTMYNPFVYIIGHPRFKRKMPCTCSVSFSIKDASDTTNSFSSSGSSSSTNRSRRNTSMSAESREHAHKAKSEGRQRKAMYQKLPNNAEVSETDRGDDLERLMELVEKLGNNKDNFKGHNPLGKLLQMYTLAGNHDSSREEPEMIPLTFQSANRRAGEDTHCNAQSDNLQKPESCQLIAQSENVKNPEIIPPTVPANNVNEPGFQNDPSKGQLCEINTEHRHNIEMSSNQVRSCENVNRKCEEKPYAPHTSTTDKASYSTDRSKCSSTSNFVVWPKREEDSLNCYNTL